MASSNPAARPRGLSIHDPRERAAHLVTGCYATALAITVLVWFVDRPLTRRVLDVVFGTLNVPATPSLVSIVVLTLIVGALLRRKRMALISVAFFQVLGLIWSVLLVRHLINYHASRTPTGLVADLGVRGVIALEGLAILVGVGILVVLWWIWPAFPARIAPGSWQRSVLVLVGGFTVSLFVAHSVVSTEPDADPMRRSSWTVTRAALRDALGFVFTEDRLRLDAASRPVSMLLEVMLSTSLLLAVYFFFRSARSAAAWDGDAEVRVRQLIAEYGGGDSLSYFATRRDRCYAFSRDRRAVVAYQPIGSVCLASGDPIGAADAWPDAVDAWLATARRYAWVPAVTAVGERGARLLAGHGFGIVTLGAEAVLTPERFTIDSTSLTSVRRAVAAARRAGLQVRIRRHRDLSGDDMAEVRNRAEAWRAADTERGFSMSLGRFGDPADARCVLVSAHAADGELLAFLSFVPWGRAGLSLDLMRRSPKAPNGTNELMVAELMNRTTEWGGAQVSLNFAVARSVFADAERLGAGPLTRMGSSVLGLLDRFTQIESLYRSNEKYRPQWQPRYVCVEGALALPRVTAAILRAEGFLPRWLRGSPYVRRDLTADQLSRSAAAETVRPQLKSLRPQLSDQERHRSRHLDELREVGMKPYSPDLGCDYSLCQVDEATWMAWMTAGEPRRVSARVCAIRRHGGVVFVQLLDQGVAMQAVAEERDLGRDRLRAFGRCLDAGDLVVLIAVAGTSRNGTPSLLVRGWNLAAKALRPVPYGGFDDPGLRVRRRSTDLVVHPSGVHRLLQRSSIVRTVRETLHTEGYREVETPILVAVHGGANARPFRTHSQAYGVDLVLRIAPELALKRLLAGGLGPIFELGRNFRNEGADATHNPEFTSLEVYRPFSDYMHMRDLTERLIRAAAVAVHGAQVIPLPETTGGGRLVDISGPWPVRTVCEAVSATVGTRITQHTQMETLLEVAHQHRVHIQDDMGTGAVLEALYAELVEPATRFPTFYVDFPVETSPLTAPHRSQPGLAERWDLVVDGMEIGTAYSELVDPLVQRRRLTEQSWKAAAGDPEAMQVDEDFLHALEIGMPPAGGLGIGIDRLVMMLVGGTIRDCLAFPFVRPERSRPELTAG